MANRIIGISKIHYAILDEATGKYGVIKPIKGAKNLTVSSELSETKFYSDNVIDYMSQQVNSMSVELEMAYVDAEVEAELLGKTVLENGAIVETSAAAAPTIALFYEFKTLELPIRKVLYKCKLTKDGDGAKTQEDSISEDSLFKYKGIAIADERGNFNLSLDSNNVPVGKEEAFQTAFDSFFTKMVLSDGTVQTAPAKEVKIK